MNCRVPFPLRRSESGERVDYICLDVSARGLGISSTDALLPDTRFLLWTGAEEVELGIVWATAGNGDTPTRYGLKSLRDDVDLDQAFLTVPTGG